MVVMSWAWSGVAMVNVWFWGCEVVERWTGRVGRGGARGVDRIMMPEVGEFVWGVGSEER